MPKIVYTLLAVLIFFGAVTAQTSKGKLTGKVTDADSDDPLVGVNVMIDGTKLGDATDLDGRYSIINVDPGEYSVSASMIGYGKVITTKVIVGPGKTVEVNFKLSPSTVQLQTVTVVEKRDVIVKDRTSTESLITSKEITTAPVEGVRGILDLSSSIQQNANGTYSVRGGGAFQLKFQINGVNQVHGNTGVPGYNAGFGDRSNTSWK